MMLNDESRTKKYARARSVDKFNSELAKNRDMLVRFIEQEKQKAVITIQQEVEGRESRGEN